MALGRGDRRSSTFWKGKLWICGNMIFSPAGPVDGPGPLSAVLCQLWEAHHSPLHLHRVQRDSGVELEWGQIFCVRGHHVFPPCCIHMSMLSRVSFPAPGSLNIIHLTVFKMGGVTEAGGLAVWGQPGLWNETPFYPFFPPKPFMICCWAANNDKYPWSLNMFKSTDWKR